MRVTEQMLRELTTTLNRRLARPERPWTCTGEGVTRQMTGNIGCFYVEPILGYFNLVEMAGKSGATHQHYSGSTREVYAYLRGMLAIEHPRDLTAALVGALDDSAPGDIEQATFALAEAYTSLATRANRRVIAGILRTALRTVLRRCN